MMVSPQQILDVLNSIPEGAEWTTNQVTAEVVARTDAFDTKEAVMEVYAVLKRMTPELTHCWKLGTPRVNKYKRAITPKIWFRPKSKTCPHCGGKL